MKRCAWFICLVVMLAALCMPSAFCLAQTQQDAARVHEIVQQLAQMDNYADSTAFALLSEADNLMADVQVAAAVSDADKPDLQTYRRYYRRDNCLLELNRRMGDHTFTLKGGRTQTYLDIEWQQLSALVQAYCDAIDGYTEEEMSTQLDALMVAIARLPTQEDVYDNWYAMADKVVAEACAMLTAHINQLRSAVGLAALSSPAFSMRSVDNSLAGWDRWVADHVTDGDEFVAFFHTAVQATFNTDLRATEQQMQVAWQGFSDRVQAVTGIVVPVEDAAVMAAKAQLLAYIDNALSTSPIVDFTGQAKQYYIDLAAQCRADLQGAVTAQQVRAVSDYYTAKFDVQVPTTGNNRMWLWIGISMGVALVCFVLYFVLKRRVPVPKDTRQSAQAFLAQLQALHPADSEGNADGDAPSRLPPVLADDVEPIDNVANTTAKDADNCVDGDVAKMQPDMPFDETKDLMDEDKGQGEEE